MRDTCGSTSQPKPAPASPAWTPHDAASPRCGSLAQVGPGAYACVAVSASLVRRGQERGASIRTLRREDPRGSAACETRAGNFGDMIQSSGEGLDDARDARGLEDRGPCPHQYPQTMPRDRGGPRVPSSRDAGLPQPSILSRLRDAMRTPSRGAVSWRWCPVKRDRQLAFMMWALLAPCAAAAASGPPFQRACPPVQPSALRAPRLRASRGSSGSHPHSGPHMAPAGRVRVGMVASRGPQQRAWHPWSWALLQ